jgi:hypothetical protein
MAAVGAISPHSVVLFEIAARRGHLRFFRLKAKQKERSRAAVS